MSPCQTPGPASTSPPAPSTSGSAPTTTERSPSNPTDRSAPNHDHTKLNPHEILILHPTNGRATIDQDHVLSLAADIAVNGLLNPVTVRPNGARYELLAGRHRFLALQHLGWPSIPVTIARVDDAGAAAIRLTENVHRNQLTPIEEAQQLHPMVEADPKGTIGVAVQLGRTQNWVEDRLELLEYPESLLAALHTGRIGLGAAKALARIQPDDLQREYIQHAVTHGITARTAAQWLQQTLTSAEPQLEVPEKLSTETGERIITTTTARCVRCETQTPIENTHIVRICHACIDAIDRPPPTGTAPET